MENDPNSSEAQRPVLSPEEKIRHFPQPVRESFMRFQSEGDASALNPVILAILEDYIPKTPASPLSSLPGSTRLIQDLGFDSLAITEVVFFTEDLLGIRISNDEILKVQTLDDLVGFVHEKVGTPRAE